MNAVRGRLLVTLKLGEMPDHVPGWRACSRYGAAMADRIDGGVIDRLLRHHGGALRAVRLHSARRRAANARSPAATVSTRSNRSAASRACCASR
jgi:hypothetical protein